MRNWLLSKKIQAAQCDIEKTNNLFARGTKQTLLQRKQRQVIKRNIDERKHQHQSLIVKEIEILKKDVILPNAN